MDKINCSIVRDLLPLYADNLTSDESNKLIKEHFEHCPECKKLFSDLTKTVEIDSDETEKEVDYLKKIKNRKRRAIFITVYICILFFILVSFVGFKVYIKGSPVSPIIMEYQTDYNEQTRELTITGSFSNAKTEVSGVKVEEDVRMADTINITVYGAERFSDTKEYNKEFVKTIKIPDNGAYWQVYLLGESPHEALRVWTNYYDMEDKAKAVLTEYLTNNKGFSPDKDVLLFNQAEEINLPIIDGFIWEWHENDSITNEPESIWAVSTDSSQIFAYDKVSNSWKEVAILAMYRS